MGRDDIHRPFDIGVGDDMLDAMDEIVDGDPAPVLLARSYFTSKPPFKGGHNIGEGAPLGGQNHAKAHIHSADPFSPGILSRLLPLAAHIG